MSATNTKTDRLTRICEQLGGLNYIEMHELAGVVRAYLPRRGKPDQPQVAEAIAKAAAALLEGSSGAGAIEDSGTVEQLSDPVG